MIPGVNPRQLKQMMRQMGMSQDEISTDEIIIKTKNITRKRIFLSFFIKKLVRQELTRMIKNEIPIPLINHINGAIID